MKKTLIILLVVAALLLLAVPVGAHPYQPPVVEKTNGTHIIGMDVLAQPGLTPDALGCICYMMRHEPTMQRIPRANVPV